MDQRTRDALEKSIEHWRKDNVEGPIEAASVHGTKCALCDMFAGTDFDNCVGCPIFESTGGDDCDGSPYWPAYSAFHAWMADKTPANEAAFRAAAREELAFLESLREKDGEEQ